MKLKHIIYAAALSVTFGQAIAQPAPAASAPAVNQYGKVLGEGQPRDVSTPPVTGSRASRSAERRANGIAAVRSGETVEGEGAPPESQPRPGVRKPTVAGARRLNAQGKAVDKRSTVLGEKDAQR